MLKNKLDKKIAEIEPSFENILICNNEKSRPFIEVMVQDPENVEQQNLGTLIGIFEISDISGDSSYVVNYLLSIIKKEYFSRPRRGPVESFEAALHKANLALSKLAEHKNVNWIGKLNVVCATFEKNHLHLAKTGAASAFLLRSKTLTDISEDLSEQNTELNPLKTFDNVSSGKLEAGDKLIITTDNIFDIFSFEEIKKSALRFSDGELIQFLKTALGNELERAVALIVSIKEKAPELEIAAPRRPVTKINAFSQATFVKPSKPEALSGKIESEIKEELDKSKDEFVNKKTGHIYIKGADHSPVESNFLGDLFFHLNNFFEFLGEKISRSGRIISIALKKHFQVLRTKIHAPKAPYQKINFRHWVALIKGFLLTPFNSTGEPEKPPETVKIEEFPKSPEISKSEAKFSVLPSFSRLKDSLAPLSYEHKLYAILVVLAIFLVPYFGLRISNEIAKKKAPVVQETPREIIPLEQDKNVTRLENLATAYSGNDILKTINLNGKFFVVTQTEISALDSGEKFAIPDNFGQIATVSEMNDLNFIFLISLDKKITAFSPISKKFQDNTLAIPTDSNIIAAQTYLTYLYLLDAKNNQIYRYPRAEGGFGAKSDWIKETFDLSAATDMAINENIFVADGKNILKLFHGKTQDFNLEQSATPITPYKINVNNDGSAIYILDKNNSRIVKLDASGNIIRQFYNPEIGKALDLSVDETSSTVYFSTSSAVKSFKME